jgi:hypothetical protein
MLSSPLPPVLTRAGFTARVLAQFGWTGEAGNLKAEVNGQGIVAWALEGRRYQLACLMATLGDEVSHAGLCDIARDIDLGPVLDEDTTLPNLLLDLGANAARKKRAGSSLRWAIMAHGKMARTTANHPGLLRPSSRTEAWTMLVARLLEKGADANDMEPGADAPTPVALALVHAPSLVPLLALHGADLGWTDKKGKGYEERAKTSEAREALIEAQNLLQQRSLETTLPAAPRGTPAPRL